MLEEEVGAGEEERRLREEFSPVLPHSARASGPAAGLQRGASLAQLLSTFSNLPAGSLGDRETSEDATFKST